MTTTNIGIATDSDTFAGISSPACAIARATDNEYCCTLSTPMPDTKLASKPSHTST
jgi:hypothetical protein